MITAGVDIGQRNTKAVLLDDGGRIVAKVSARTGFDFEKAAAALYDECLALAGIRPDDVSYVVATGFGRYRLPFRDANVTDITANSRGAKFLFPGTSCFLDVGAGSARAAKIDENGRILKFRATDKCAAGGGGFLEKIAFYTGVDIADLGRIALTSTQPVSLSTVCSVLAESEVINFVTQEVPMENILMGACNSVVGRVLLTLRQVGPEPQVTLTGGLNFNVAVPRIIEERLKLKPNASAELYYAGAIGAAVLGLRRVLRIGGSPGMGG